MLLVAAINQIVQTVADAGYPIAGTASQRLLAAHPGGMLDGPRSLRFQTD